MPVPLAVVREQTLIEAKQFLYQHPFNTDGTYGKDDLIELIRGLVKEYEAHLPLATRHRACSVANGHERTINCEQSVSPLG